MLIAFTNYSLAQVIYGDYADKKYSAWKQSKLYVVKTTDNEINTELENAIKASFQNYAGTVSVTEADKLMKNDNNFFATVIYPGANLYKVNAWDKYASGIGIFQGSAKKFLKIAIVYDYLVFQEYLPLAPNLNVTMYATEARNMYVKGGFDKTFKPEPTIKAMIPSTVLNLKQCLDALEKTEGVKGEKKMYQAVGKILSEDAKILKNKTLVVLNNSLNDDFYNAYAFKKEKAEPNDISKLSSKNKEYCFLKYTIQLKTFNKQVTVIDCETGKIIYQKSYLGSATMTGISKKQTEDLNNAVKGIIKE